MLRVTLFLLETEQGRKGAPYAVCIRPKPEEKVEKVFWIHLEEVRFFFSFKNKRIGLSGSSVSSQPVTKPPVGVDALTQRRALSQLRAPQVLLSFDAEPLFVSQNDLMPNQGVSRILITPLEARYLRERAQTVIRAKDLGVEEGRGFTAARHKQLLSECFRDHLRQKRPRDRENNALLSLIQTK